MKSVLIIGVTGFIGRYVARQFAETGWNVIGVGTRPPENAPFQCDDVDACIRAWLAGYQVGFYPCPFLRDVGRGGMRAFNSKIVPQQAATNWQKIYSAYSPHITNGDIQSCANSANKALIPFF